MDEKQCPYCKEWIPEELTFCPYCMNKLTEKKKLMPGKAKWNKKVLVTVVVFVCIALLTVYIWTLKNTEDIEAYADYMGAWYGEKGAIAAELKIEEVKNKKLNGYVILSQKDYELLRTDFSGEIREDGTVLASYDTGNEQGRIRLELQNNRIEISAYQTEAEEMNVWEFGRLPVIYLERIETGSG